MSVLSSLIYNAETLDLRNKLLLTTVDDCRGRRVYSISFHRSVSRIKPAGQLKCPGYIILDSLHF